MQIFETVILSDFKLHKMIV